MPKKTKVQDAFRGYRNGALALNGLKSLYCIYCNYLPCRLAIEDMFKVNVL